ncbi:glycosyltransferase [Ammoniphilus sp. YIM 78166]|uniref:glycosyltransferase n=1 Tax=Ammoniphilus sp. YIM 78166 TaxID=1644106 RepID=UPI00106F93D9|nr:glycosyltransferase [Ammoniphilus sp. YIM 78166]
MNVGTISTINYLPQAILMAKSVRKHMPECRIVLCLLEREKPKSFEGLSYFDTIILARELGFDNFDHYIFKYSNAPASFSLKGKLLLHLIDKYPADKTYIYLDSDIQIFSRFEEVFSELNEYPIVLTPHLLQSPEKEVHMWRETGILQTGMFNAGFLAVRRCLEARQFLRWWDYRLENYCYSDIKNGICFDQRWLDLVPGLFNTSILKHPGYNAAWWNLSERRIQMGNDGGYHILGKPLRFFHFSGLNKRLDQMIRVWYREKSDIDTFLELKGQYLRQLKDLEKKFIKTPWSYGYFESGEIIKDRSRKIYRKNEKLYLKKFGNPFRLENSIFSKKIVKKLKSKKS